MLEAVVETLIDSYDAKKTTSILTTKNDEAVQVLGLLNRNKTSTQV